MENNYSKNHKSNFSSTAHEPIDISYQRNSQLYRKDLLEKERVMYMCKKTIIKETDDKRRKWHAS